MKTSVLNIALTIAALAIAINSPVTSATGSAAESTPLRAGVDSQAVSIQYSQVDLSSDQGREKLHRQIRQAAKNVCGPTTWREAGSLSQMSRNRQCYDDAVASAMSQLDTTQVASRIAE